MKNVVLINLLIVLTESLRDAAKLLGVPKHSLAEMLTQRALLLREELIVTPFSTKQVFLVSFTFIYDHLMWCRARAVFGVIKYHLGNS